MIDSTELIQRLKLWDKKSGQWIYFVLWDIQKQFLQQVHTKKKILSLKKRQVGFSQLTGADSLIQCMAQQNFTVLILSISSDDARVFLDRIRGMYGQIPTLKEIQEQANPNIHDAYLAGLKATNKVIKGLDGGEEMVFQSGSSIVSLSCQKGRGRTADRVVLDEMAFYTLRNSKIELETVLKSITPTLDRSDGQLIGVTTANGLGKFYQMFIDAVYGRNGYSWFFVSCYDDPDFTEEKRASIIKDDGEDHANQEYPRTWREAFLASGSPRFEQSILLEYEENAIKPIATGDIEIKIVEQDGKKYRQEQIVVDGQYTFYQPYNPKGTYLITGDVAEGLDHGDYSVAKCFEVATGCQVVEWHGHCEPSEFGDVCYKLGVHYNFALIAIEANNHGISANQRLKDLQYKNIFQGTHASVRSDDKYKNPSRRYGWMTTDISKKLIIDNLASLLLQRAIPYFNEQDVRELQYYIKKNGKTNAQEGHYDDRVMCLAIAYYLIQFVEQVNPEYKCYTCQNYNNNNCEQHDYLRRKDALCKFYSKVTLDTLFISDTSSNGRYRRIERDTLDFE